MIRFTAQQKILVTGASSGIGRATALLLNRLGAVVIASGRKDKTLQDVRAASDAPENFHVEVKDLAYELDLLPAWVASLRERHGKLHGFAHCAGQTWNEPMQAYTREKALKTFDICCHAPLLLAKGFIDRRNNTGPGASLVFIAAAAALAPNRAQGMYAAAKAALITAARCLSLEVAPRKLRVNCVSPGLVETPMMDETVRLLGNEFLLREAEHYPLGIGQPTDVAGLAAYLLSEQARWMTGNNILITGGR